MFLAFDKLRDADPAELIQTKVANSRATVEDLGNAGAWERFKLLNDGRDGEAVAVTGENLSGGKMHMIRPKDDPEIPWTALIIGLWIPNFFYWGLNQYIVQRTLGSRSLAEGQKGIVFAAALKMLIPFIVVIPGILCFNLFSKDLREEAVKRNAATLEQLASPGGAAVVYPFSENFALTDPAQAAMVVAHNARVLGAAVPDGLDGAPAMFAANEELIAGLPGVNGNSARGQRITSGTKLIGYDYDAAFPTLLRNLLKPGLAWFVLAAIFGAVVSSLASMLNSASTIATMDIVSKIGRKLHHREMSQSALVASGRICVVVFVLVACLIAPGLGDPKFGGIFTFIQEFQGFISPGILAVYLFGFLVVRTPRYMGWVGILLNAVLYGALKWWIAPGMPFLNRMAVCFGIVCATLAIVTILRPLRQPVVMPQTDLISLESSKSAKVWGIVVVVVTLMLYWMFW
jgi:SSS family solute:Na+ symporter